MRCKCTPSAPARYPCRSREILRYTTQRAIPRTIGKQEGVRAEARTMELRAVAQLAHAATHSPAPPCRRAPTHLPPPQYPARRNVSAASSGVASQSAMRTQEGVRAEARTAELRAVAQLARAAARSPYRPAAALRRTRRRCSTLRAATCPQQAAASPHHRAASSRPTSRCCAPPARALACLCGAPCARTVWTAPKPALRAGGRVELPPPPPPARGAAAPSSLVVPVIAGRSGRQQIHNLDNGRF